MTHLVKDILQSSLGQSRALYVFHRTEFPGQSLALLHADRLQLLPRQLLQVLGIFPQVDLGADDEAGNTRAVVVHLWEPLLLDVFERCRRSDGEANEEDVGLGI